MRNFTSLFNILLIAVLTALMATSCDLQTELEDNLKSTDTHELQRMYNGLMVGDWEYMYEDSVSHTEQTFTFNDDGTASCTFNMRARNMFYVNDEPYYEPWENVWRCIIDCNWTLVHLSNADMKANLLYLTNINIIAEEGLLEGSEMWEFILFYGIKDDVLTLSHLIYNMQKCEFHRVTSDSE